MDRRIDIKKEIYSTIKKIPGSIAIISKINDVSHSNFANLKQLV